MSRDTRQREAILNILRGAASHPTADWHDEVRKVIPNISKGTVYRNLKMLRDTGQISELNLSGGASRFEGRKDNHYHFGCERCGWVCDVDEPVDTELDRRVAGENRLNNFLPSTRVPRVTPGPPEVEAAKVASRAILSCREETERTE